MEEGRMLQLGALMAMHETGGRVADLSVEMVVYDSPCDLEGAIATARQLAADPSISAVVGHLCAEAVAAALPIYQEAHLALINPTVSVEYVRKDESRHLFPLLYGDGEQAAFIAAYIKRGLGLTRVAVISDESTYGNILRASFLAEAELLGLELVAKLSIKPNQDEAARAAELLKDARPEAIFLATYPEAARLFLLERQQQRLAGEVLGPDQLGDLDLYEMAGKAAEGLLVCQPILLDTGNAEEDGFVRRFELLHKRQPDWIAAGGYDAMRLAQEVLIRSGPGRKAFLEALREISGPDVAFGGLSGPVFFRNDGTSQRPLYVGIIRQGKLWAAKPPTVEFPFLPSRE
jgi:branched-chain amino acid transport system substrate-binding protein